MGQTHTTHNMGQVTQTSMFVAPGKDPSNQPQTSKLLDVCNPENTSQYKDSTVHGAPSCDSANTSAQQDTKKRQCDASHATGPWRVEDSIG